MSWFYCVTNFANPRVVSIVLWPHPFAGLTGAILAITNQMLQSWRIYLFTGNKILTGFLVATSVAACGMAVAAAIEAWPFSECVHILLTAQQLPGPMSFQSHRQANLILLQSIVMVNSALQCAIDVIIAGELYLFLVA
ncbi:hypothetical protein DFH09DRAFT_1167589 [Mycena vulgaris]|nr:hypothetical protein DFH09DRAFT_1167589 [Mycena vulgaris]